MSGHQGAPTVFVVPHQKVTTRHYVADFNNAGFDIRLTETRITEYEAVCDALASFLHLMRSLDAEQQMFFMGVMIDAVRGKDSGIIRVHGERYLYLPDERGDRSRDVFVTFTEAEQKPSSQRKAAGTKKTKAKPTPARKGQADAQSK